MLSLGRTQSIALKELKQLRRDRLTFGMVVMIPLIQLLLFGYAINTNVRNVPVGVVDMSESAAGRILVETVKATQVVNFVAHYNSPSEAKTAVTNGDVRAALVIPADLAQRIVQGEPLGQWMVDGSDTMISSALFQLQNMDMSQVLMDPSLNLLPPHKTFAVTLFFNPERRSAINIVPGLTGVILTMTMILFTSTAIVREREHGNLELLITTPIKPMELMLGKIVPYIFVGLVQVAIVLGLGHWIFGVPISGDLLDILGVTLLFIAASLTLGLIISTVAKTQMQAMQMTVFVLLPSILLSGFMFPYEAMPKPAQYLAEILPATHFMRLIRAVVLRGAEFASLTYDTLWLAGFTVVGIGVASLRFNKSLD